MPPTRSRQSSLQSVQGLRGLAALLVVAFHASQIWRDGAGVSSNRLSGLWDSGYAGVDLFFVISGFVMVWASWNVAPSIRAAGRFAWSRLTRIYPVWWIFCGLMSAYFLIQYGEPAAPGQGGMGALLSSLSLWPTGTLPVLTVGWTLTFEIAFYGLFTLLIFLPRPLRMVALMCWGGILIVLWIVSSPSILPDSWLGVLTHPLCLEFVFGAMIAWLILTVPIRTSWAWAALGLGTSAFLIAMGVFHVMSQSADVGGLIGTARVWSYGLPAVLIILGCVRLEQSGQRLFPQTLRAVGDASYSLYLAHLLVLLALKRVADATVGIPNTVLSFILFLFIGTVVSCLAAIISYHGIERPLLRLLRPQRSDALS